ncbi:hypothetical protein LRP49_16980 [Enterovibrio sp. ZSDZ35]|uniref:Tetratricopeptide repeat-containing protein n=1 Tax=Enterovibrio qingdaonensis TaxID=2899818 RepID=A0ABT5QPF9_9GAMM|nr:hypothetical protein [Enterovibrio sp. ZSDZ35]MDD1782870.1 hypothetical protein [Enterovibrio sp. ZSDZ35]
MTLASLLTIGLAGCANMSVQGLFSHYSAGLAESRSLAQQGAFSQAIDALPAGAGGEVLDELERSRFALLAGDNAQTREALDLADLAVKEQANQAAIQISEGFNQVGALATNDNMLTYVAPSYELGFLHLYLIRSYLEQGDLQGALVEVRRAKQIQEEAKKLRDKELTLAEESAHENGISDNVGAILSRYPDAGSTLGAVQNAYLFYLSALLYDAEGNENSAFIDYNRALAVAPDNQYVAEAAMRIASKQRRKNDLTLLERKYGDYSPPAKGSAKLVVLAEDGWVDPRLGWRLPLWLTDNNGNVESHTLALPYYAKQREMQPLSFSLDGKTIRLDALADVNAMARHALNEAMPGMAVRQILRVVAKNEFHKSISKNDESGLGSLLTSVYNAVSEQPDTRSWQTLPARASLYSGYMRPGQHELKINGKTITVNLTPERTTLLWLSTASGEVVDWQGTLGGV